MGDAQQNELEGVHAEDDQLHYSDNPEVPVRPPPPQQQNTGLSLC